MKPAPFELHIPQSLQEALGMVSDLANARVIAGGQSLMPMLNMRLAMPDHIIDLNGIAEMQSINEVSGTIAIGAMTRQRDLEFSALIQQKIPLMTEAILLLGHRQTRNRGTIGGSLCHLDPSAELPTVCMAMDATLVCTGAGGERLLPMQIFAEGMMTTSLAPDELLTEIRLTPWAPDHGYSFIEFGRRHGDFAIASAAVLIDCGRDGRVTRASLTLGGVGPVPIRVGVGEAMLLGSDCNTALLDAAAAEAGMFDALDDPAYPAAYRRRLAKMLLRRALDVAVRRARKTTLN
jgi:carbon-monoxide dehydrogenase medium subunit